MNLKELKEMVELMNENGLSELEVDRDGMKIKLKKALDNSLTAQPVSYALPAVPVVPRVTSAKDSLVPLANVVDNKANYLEIKSPMVGTFYRAASPEAATFIEIGQTVEVDQVVCIVEAMKLMNEIKSEVCGKIVEICVDNAEPVEFGQVLFRVAP
jgi:acetyl-CoA carboxylase biotin carboxyl carrier protein